MISELERRVEAARAERSALTDTVNRLADQFMDVAEKVERVAIARGARRSAADMQQGTSK